MARALYGAARPLRLAGAQPEGDGPALEHRAHSPSADIERELRFTGRQTDDLVAHTRAILAILVVLAAASTAGGGGARLVAQRRRPRNAPLVARAHSAGSLASRFSSRFTATPDEMDERLGQPTGRSGRGGRRARRRRHRRRPCRGVVDRQAGRTGGGGGGGGGDDKSASGRAAERASSIERGSSMGTMVSFTRRASSAGIDVGSQGSGVDRRGMGRFAQQHF